MDAAAAPGGGASFAKGAQLGHAATGALASPALLRNTSPRRFRANMLAALPGAAEFATAGGPGCGR